MSTPEGSDFTLNVKPENGEEFFCDKDYNANSSSSEYIILEIKESEEVTHKINAPNVCGAVLSGYCFLVLYNLFA